MAKRARTVKDKPIFYKEALWKVLRDNDYGKFPESRYEPSCYKPIKKNDLSLMKLAGHLEKYYGAGSKPEFHLAAITKIITTPYAESIIKEDRSEYYKLLCHFAILSKVKQGWSNLFITGPIKKTKSSLSDNPSRFAVKKSKQLHDAIIRCFYTRLFQGMSTKEQNRYKILSPEKHMATGFDRLIFDFDLAIQNLFLFMQKNIEGYDNEHMLPDAVLDETAMKTRNVLQYAFNQNEKEGLAADTLHATLIKFATINRVTNDIDVIFNIQNELLDNLPNDIQHLKHIESEDKILPTLASTFNQQLKKLPGDLIKCAQIVCKMYILTGTPYNEKNDVLTEFNDLHMQPYCIAVSAALLYYDYLRKSKLKVNIRGETNKGIPIYKTLSKFAKRIDKDVLTPEFLWHHGFSEDLFKYLTARYSISVFGLSDSYPSQIGAAAHLRVKLKKFEIQKEAYELLKGMSIEDASLFIRDFCWTVKETIHIAGCLQERSI
ncbi:hypothetical protein JWZ98_02580 [Methylomonas sp. EFPC1]|uniref:hypothetical protein n=1 Tax=Methylomonas sp. EFPC1 TaxID=2812647 RepID=UPI00196735A5|nr:hypothetical protein [Methylomonas sp. EFPC1]QSB01864.1 hypothetical protein JWZ98_02580 [Methylomonas sp. EFPC1]